MKKKMWMMLMLIFLLTACGNEQPMSSGMDDEGVELEVTTENEDESTNIEEPSEKEYTLKEVLVGDVAPEFTALLVDGSSFTLSENQGKVVLLNFWATWCGPCVGEMPAFQDLDEEYGDDVVVLAVNCMESKETVDRFIEETGYDFPIAYDEEGTVSFTYPSSGIPYTLVVGKDGIVRDIYVGAADADTQYQIYKAAIDEALEQ